MEKLTLILQQFRERNHSIDRGLHIGTDAGIARQAAALN
jgi:hypothetical protein